MDRERFERMVSAYGARPEEWPDDERDAALALLRESADARAWFDRESRLDAWLDAAPSHVPSAALRDRVLGGAPRPRPSWSVRLDGWASAIWPGARPWRPIGALAAAGAIGVAVGVVGPNGDDDAEAFDASDFAAFDLGGPEGEP